MPLAAGKHEVQIDFLPPGYRVGLGISLLTLLAVCSRNCWRGRREQEKKARGGGRTGEAQARADNGRQPRLFLKQHRAESKGG